MLSIDGEKATDTCQMTTPTHTGCELAASLVVKVVQMLTQFGWLTKRPRNA